MALRPITKLERAVALWIRLTGRNPEECFRDLENGGCAGGCVSRLISYHDIFLFYRKHRRDIGDMIVECIRQGVLNSPSDLKDWDMEDPFAFDAANQTLLTWYAFEMAARQLAYRSGIII